MRVSCRATPINIICCFSLCINLVCDDCEDLHYRDCPVHGPLHAIEDNILEESSKLSVAVASTPEVLRIGPSSIPGAGLGVFSTTLIPKGVRFGPYKGEKIGWENMTDKTNTSYFWEVAYVMKPVNSDTKRYAQKCPYNMGIRIKLALRINITGTCFIDRDKD